MTRFTHHLQWPFFFICLITLTGCQLLTQKEEDFRFNPARHKDYNYTLTITSAHSTRFLTGDITQPDAGKESYDTVLFDFSLKNIYYADSIIICKMTFNDLKIMRPPLRIMISHSGLPAHEMEKNPLAILDSIGIFIQGLSVQVVISNKGVVKEVDGVDDMMREVSGASNEPHIKMLLKDYISVNAIKDLLNRVFSVVPQGNVQKDDRWVRNVTLVTKAPVKISNLYTFRQRIKDTAFVDIESIVSAEQSEGGTVYMKGKQTGHTIVSYSTGMPWLYETRWETVTTTSHQYEVIRKEHFLLESHPLVSR